MNVSDLAPAKKVHKPVSLNWRDLSLRNKIILAILLIEVVSIGVLAYFALTRAGQIVASVSSKFENSVQAQTEAQLTDIVKTEVADADQLFSSTKDSLVKLADYRAQLESQNAILGQNAYWDANTKLSLLPEGQYGNSAKDVASVFLPKTMTVDDKVLAELNTSAFLDFIAPGILKSQPQLVAIYYMSALGSTTYYPNIELATLVPADFDILSQPFYTIADPQNDPERIPRWTDPYQDPAGTGLIVTASAPVYSKGGFFKGVIGIDMQLARISENISQIKIGETGFAFLVDKTGRILAMPPEGYALFGLQPEEVPVNESPKETILGKGSEDLQAVMNRLVSGESGLSTVVINDVETYIGYAPLNTPGYSLVVMAPASELNSAIVTSREETQNATTSAFQVTAFILIGLLVGAILLSLGVSQIITAPLTRLTQTAEQITSGDYSARAVIETKDETGTLATAFNRMADQLRDSIATLEQRVTDRTKALATSTEVSRRLSTILNQEQLVNEVVNQVKNAFGYYHTQIYFYDDAKDNLVMAGGTGEAGAMMLAQFHKVAKGRGLVGRAAESNQAVLVADTAQNPDWLPNVLLPDTKSEMVIPISIGDEVLGVLDVQQNVTGGLQQEDVDSLQSIANQVAIALQNARIFTQAEQQRHQNELILGSAGEGIFGLDKQGNHTFVNPAGAGMLGYSVEELIGKHSHTTWHHTHADGTPFPGEECPIYFTLKDGTIHQGEEYFIRKDGSGFYVNFSSVPIQEEGRIVGAVVTFADVTQQKYEREFTAQRAKQQEALNLITQRIQNTTSVEAALQIAARELGHALGMKSTRVTLKPEVSRAAATSYSKNDPAYDGEHKSN